VLPVSIAAEVLARGASAEGAPASLGNFPDRIAQASRRGGSLPLRFAVLGDVQGGTVALGEALRHLRDRGDVAVAIQPGGLVPRDDPGHYELVSSAVRGANPGFPMLVVPGNHDVKNGGERFSRTLGPRQTAFVTAGCLFVLCDNALAPLDAEHVKFLEEALR